ncbi:MAG: SUMF1/EgtB/PvdO family nonheme iron enzyme [Candidatus Methylomirabilis sp.]
MRRLIGVLMVGAAGLILGLAAPAAEAAQKCPPDSVAVGPACLDTHEASVWEVPPTETGLIRKIKKGKATLADLTSPAAVAAGVVQRGVASDDYGAGCPHSGNGCVDFYAVSIPGVTPSVFLTWLQAAAAARNAGKRLPSNQEWQAAALGTPDPGVSAAASADCNTANGGGMGVDAVVPTGSRANCFSDVAAFDMVGNLDEWVADWVPRSTACPGWGVFSDDFMCLAGASISSGPGALIRGGNFSDGTDAGVFAVDSGTPPAGSSGSSGSDLGFRAAR